MIINTRSFFFSFRIFQSLQRTDESLQYFRARPQKKRFGVHSARRLYIEGVKFIEADDAFQIKPNVILIKCRRLRAATRVPGKDFIIFLSENYSDEYK